MIAKSGFDAGMVFYLGAGVVDRLREMGYRDIVVAVNSGERPITGALYINRRAEMWGLMRDWLAEPPVEVPDDDELHADLTGPKFSYDSNQRLRLERKEDMKKRGLRSPDCGDALALTFAEPVASKEFRNRDDEILRKHYERMNRRIV